MKRTRSTAIATARRRGAARNRVQIAAAGLAIAVLAAGCGSSGSTTTDTNASPSPSPSPTPTLRLPCPLAGRNGCSAVSVESAHPPVTGQPGYAGGPGHPDAGQCCEFTDRRQPARRPIASTVHASASNRHVGRGREARGLTLMPSEQRRRRSSSVATPPGRSARCGTQEPNARQVVPPPARPRPKRGLPRPDRAADRGPPGRDRHRPRRSRHQSVFSAHNVTQAPVEHHRDESQDDCSMTPTKRRNSRVRLPRAEPPAFALTLPRAPRLFRSKTTVSSWRACLV